MPGYDGTGPLSWGSMTGRGMGYCAVPVESRELYPTPSSNPTAGWFAFRPRCGPGLRRGRGQGIRGGRGGWGRRGFGCWW